MFHVVFGRLKNILVLYVVSNSLRLFCVIPVVFSLLCGGLGSSCWLVCPCQVVWSVLFVKVFKIVAGCLACLEFFGVVWIGLCSSGCYWVVSGCFWLFQFSPTSFRLFQFVKGCFCFYWMVL